jgi:hypothetical protein
MKVIHTLLPSALLAICLAACGPAELPALPTDSAVSNGTYINSYFGLSIPIPDGWFIASTDSEEFLREVGGDALVGDDAMLKAALEASKKTTFQLLTVSEYELGAPVTFNPNLMVLAERVSHTPGVKSGEDYLFHVAKLLLQAALPYEVVRDAHPVQLGIREWSRAQFRLNQPQNPIEQTYISVKKGEYALSMILSAATQEQMLALEQISETVILE